MTGPAGAVRPRRPAGPLSGAREMADPPDLGSGDTAFDSRVPDAGGCSSAGRASVRQTEGQRFEAAQLHRTEAPPGSTPPRQFHGPLEQQAAHLSLNQE